MNKVDKLVEWAANRLWWLDSDFDTEEEAVKSRFYTEVMKDIYRRKVKQIFSHPDLALIDREHPYAPISLAEELEEVRWRYG